MEYDYLQHWGVKGQKWGVRRYQNKDGSLTPAGKKRYDSMSDDAKTVADLRKKSVSEMSNAELKKYNERVRLEQEYSRLNPSAVKRGLAVTATVVGAIGTVASLYDNSNRLVKIGKQAYNFITKK